MAEFPVLDGKNIIEDLKSIRDGVIMGSFPGFGMSKSGGTASQPANILYTKGNEVIKLALTWGASGGEDGNVTQAICSYSSDAGASYSVFGTETITYDADGYVVTAPWA